MYILYTHTHICTLVSILILFIVGSWVIQRTLISAEKLALVYRSYT